MLVEHLEQPHIQIHILTALAVEVLVLRSLLVEHLVMRMAQTSMQPEAVEGMRLEVLRAH